MSTMQIVDGIPWPSSRPQVRENESEYVVGLQSGFTADELTVEALGSLVTVRGDQVEAGANKGHLRLHNYLEESFRLPDDADLGRLRAFYDHGSLEIHAPRRMLRPDPVPVEPRPRLLINPEATPC